ncbi:MAG: kinase [Thermoplasmataceae archaeon]|jgi:D-glycero-alpha-D-manno-heptose-7-phosphate kinase
MWDFVSFAPLRVSFAGGGTDIPPYVEKYGGSVLNTTIDRGVMVKYKDDGKPLELSSRDFLQSFTMISGHHEPSSFVEEIGEIFAENGIRTGRVLISSDVPPGSGLGSSSALLVSLLNLISEIKKNGWDRSEVARMAYDLERNRLKIVLGKQDPYAISFSGFKLMEFPPGKSEKTTFAETWESVRKIEERSLLLYTGRTRESSEVLKDQVRKSSTGDSETLARMDELKKLAHEMWNYIREGDTEKFIEGINRGWNIKKMLGRNVTNERVDGIINAAFLNGAVGAKLLGGGGEGFILLISGENRLVDLQSKMSEFSDFIIRISFSGRCYVKNE